MVAGGAIMSVSNEREVMEMKELEKLKDKAIVKYMNGVISYNELKTILILINEMYEEEFLRNYRGHKPSYLLREYNVLPVLIQFISYNT